MQPSLVNIMMLNGIHNYKLLNWILHYWLSEEKCHQIYFHNEVCVSSGIYNSWAAVDWVWFRRVKRKGRLCSASHLWENLKAEIKMQNDNQIKRTDEILIHPSGHRRARGSNLGRTTGHWGKGKTKLPTAKITKDKMKPTYLILEFYLDIETFKLFIYT